MSDYEADNSIIFLLDVSGSMADVEEEAQRGYDNFVGKLGHADVDAEMSLYVFDSIMETVYERRPIGKTPPFQFFSRGGTRLWDSIAELLATRIGGPQAAGQLQMRQQNEHLRRLGIDPSNLGIQKFEDIRTLLVILTDGQDTSSYHSNEHDVRRLIEKVEATGLWTVVWLAAGPNAARPVWVRPGNLLDFDARTFLASMNKLTEAAVAFLESDEDTTETFFLTAGDGR